MPENNLPIHVAIIMDGNGRWAKKRNLPRTSGHLEGVKRVEEITQVANNLGIKVLTLYTFSTENWTRPQDEVSMLMRTLISALNRKVDDLNKGNIKLSWIGKQDGIPEEVFKTIERAMELTKKNTGLILNLAFNYGSRVEILNAVKAVAARVKENDLAAAQITEDIFSRELYTKNLPDPDLLIRTSGEKRISNFLLWQLSYAEFYFTETLWPDFNEAEFKKALDDFKNRERRYGNVPTN
ncbi:MAG: isoprenyl transferase [Candidatus Omnitrophota bacterium]